MATVDFPTRIAAGVSFAARVTAPEYPAPAWTVSAVLRGAGSINLTATGDNDGHSFVAPAATTAGWAPGTYWVSIRASKGSDVVELTQRQVVVLPDLAAQGVGYDGRSENEIALAAINAVLAKRATIDQQRYTIGSRELWRTPMADLLKLKSFYTVAVRRERRRAAGETSLGRPIHVRFSQ